MNATRASLETYDTVLEQSVFIPSEHFVSNSVRKTVEIFLEFFISLGLALCGIVSNVLVLVIFGKQGYKETVNISMTAIALWDLVKCVAAAMQRMAGPMQLVSQADAEGWSNIGVVAFSYLVCISSYVSSVLAAFVAIERCLCVSIPFKVKDIITPKVTFIACLVISIGVFGAFVVMWGLYDIRWVYHPGYNRSIFIYRYNDFFYERGGPIFEYYNMSGMIWPIASFVVISVCTVVIVHHLRMSSKFRTTSTADAFSGQVDKQRLSKRDRQVVKMLLVIIIVYIISLSPRITLYLVKYFIYEFYFLRLYHNLFMIVGYVLFFFDIFNAAVNFYIFLFMSSSFRSTFKSLFKCWSK